MTIRDSHRGAFITTWETDDPQTVVIFIVEGTDLIIDWGGRHCRGTVSCRPGMVLHTYAEAGQYRIIADGSVSRLYHTDGFTTPQLLRYVDQWGDINWFDMQSMFVEASNMEYRATDIPDLSNVSSMNSMFDGASSFNGNISAWNVSKVTNMQSMFHSASLFDQSLNEWDVSKVIHMPSMFQNALRFNQSLNEWDVSKVTDMSHMFFDAASFDGEISDWDVSKVIHMPGMFQSASLFNQPLSNWNVSGVNDMSDMFQNADAFDQNLGAWYVVPDGTEIARADIPGIVGVISAQNSYLDGQNPVYSIEEDDDSALFEIVNGNKLNMTSAGTKSEYAVNVTASDGTVFEDGNNWRTFEVTVTGQGNRPPVVTAGDSAYAYEGSVGRLEGTASDLDGDPLTHEWTHDGAQSLGITIANDTALSTTFAVAGDVASDTAVTFTLTVSDGTSSPVLATVDVTVRDSSGAFITTWDLTESEKVVVIAVAADSGAQYVIDWGDGTQSDQDSFQFFAKSHRYDEVGTYRIVIDGDVGRVHQIDGTTTANLLKSIDQWGDIEWTSMQNAFRGASGMAYVATNAPDLSRVTNMRDMFRDATLFDGDISKWDVSKVTYMSSMFSGAASFDQYLNDWNVSKVTDMESMFLAATAFNQSLNLWNVSGVTDMTSMFQNAASFDQSLNEWNVSKVTDMSFMFHTAGDFDGEISDWDVSKVTHMTDMFRNAPRFNQPLHNWDVSAVTNMGNMFSGATAFDQNLGAWYVVLDDTVISDATKTLEIMAQNQFLDEQSPAYGLGTGGDSEKFEIRDNSLGINATIDYSEKTSYKVNVTSTGNFGTDNHRMVDVDVSGVNRVPVLAHIGPVTEDELVLISFNATATDDDGHDLTFSLTGTDVPDGAEITDKGAFTWTPTEEQDGSHTITVQVSDDQEGGMDSQVVAITVREVNTAPSLDDIGSKTVLELEQLSFTATASDPDRVNNMTNALEYSLTGIDVPDGAEITDKGAFTWTPTEEQDGSHTITVQVSDGMGGTDTDEIDVTVNEVNGPPVLNQIPDKSANEGTLFEFDASASDGDIINGTADTLTYLLGGDTVADAVFDATTGAFTWTPTEGQDGTYTVTLKATDAIGTDSNVVDVVLTVLESNEPPTARAGTYAPHGEGVTVTLDGSGSTDPDIIMGSADPLTYLWTQTGTGNTVTLSGVDTASPTFMSLTVLQNTTLTFQLRVTDGAGAAVTDTATVLITDDINELPEARAGLARTVNEGGVAVTLDGSNSDDPNGDALTHVWEQTDGTPTVALTAAGTGRVSFATPVVATTQPLTFTLNVTDSRGGSDTDEVVITVRDSASNAPVARIAGGERDINEGVPVTLDGSASDDPNGDSLTYEWEQTGGATTVTISPDNDTASFTAPIVKQNTPLTFTLTVRDDDDSDSASVTITVINSESDTPTASVTAPQNAGEGATVTLDGTASDDPNGDSLTYLWTYDTGTPVLTLVNATAPSTTFTAPQVAQETSLGFTLTVRDTDGNSDDHSVTVRISNSQNEPPTAVASSDTGGQANEGVTVTLDGSNSDDPNGDSLTYLWTYDTGTPALVLQNPTTPSPSFLTPQVKTPTDLEFGLTVTDTHGDSDGTQITITVLDSHSNLPVSDPGLPQTVGEGTQVTLDGSNSDDPNGDPLRYEWEQVGAQSVTLSDPELPVTTFTAPQVSEDTVLEFALRVADVDGNHTRTVSVTVQNLQTNTPVARPQVSGLISEGATVTLDGTASYDPNGDDLEYSWRQVSGMPVVLLGNDTDTATFTAPRVPDPVTLVFELDVSDGITSGSAKLHVEIPDNLNDPPVIDAIPAQSEDELQIISFQASASDADDNSLRFALAGQVPRGASITPDGLFGWTPDQSQDGLYTLNVTVSDGDGGTDYEEVQVTVRDIAPMPVSAKASSSSSSSSEITLTLSEVVVSGGQGPNGFGVMTGGDPVSVVSITGNGTTMLVLGLNGTISGSDGVTLEYSDIAGDVTDLTDKPLASFSGLDVSFPQKRSGSTKSSPAVDLGTLAYLRLVDIPPHIAEQVASRDDSDPLEPLTPDGTFDFPLVINGYGYLLDGSTNTLVPQILTTGDGPVYITFTVYTQKDLMHFVLYLNLSDGNTDYADSDTYITYKDDGTTVVTDPHGYISDATITVTQEDDQIPEKKTVRVTVEFGEKPMGPTNMVAYTWNTDRKAVFVKVIDALDVVAAPQEPVIQAADPEPLEPDSVLPADPEPVLPDFADDDDAADSEPVPADALRPADDYDEAQVLTLIRMWSGFESEMITDTQLLELLGLEGYQDIDLPDWMMTELGVLAAKGDVTVDEFMLALQYVLEHA